MKRTILLLTLATAISMTMFLTGCGEQNLTAQQRKAKLIANDNLKLKNEIKIQKKLLADCEKENMRVVKVNGDTMSKLLQIVAEANLEVETLKIENAALKEKLK